MVKKISFFIGIRGASRLKIYSDLQLSFWMEIQGKENKWLWIKVIVNYNNSSE